MLRINYSFYGKVNLLIDCGKNATPMVATAEDEKGTYQN